MSGTAHHDSSNGPAVHALTRTRALALGLIALLIAGLAYVAFAPGDEPVAVPEGAKAGDLTLHACTYVTEKGEVAAECGTLVVPETRADPGSRLIALPVTRIPATSKATGPPVFFLEGGPGVSNMNFDIADRFATDRDFVMVGYRGVDGSQRLDCPEVNSAIRRASDVLGEDSFRAYADAYRSCADRLTDQGVDVASYGMVQQVDDMESARIALGYDRINLLSESAGTRAAMIYSWRYPSIQRSVMVAVNPPGAFLWDPRTTDELIGRYAALCAEDASCRTRTDDLAETMRRTSNDIPDRWLFLPIKDANVRILAFFGLMESTSAGTAFTGPVTIDGWLSAAEGDLSGLWVTSVLADVMLADMFVRGQYAAAAAALDTPAARDYFAEGPGDLSDLARAATAFGWAGGRLGEAWPAGPEVAQYRTVRTSDVETLLVGGELDFASPPQVASKGLLPYLPNGHQVVLPGFGHTETMFEEQPEATARLINTFFDSGQVDDSAFVPLTIDFTPPTAFGDVAKIAMAAMLTLAVLTILSLLVMARRVHTRGRIGPKSGAFVRSVYAFVLGLGGWFLGVLLVLVTMPAVSIDNELIVVVSVGVPIGLTIFLAWVHRAWPTRTRNIGLAAAVGGALAGAWLGFHAADGLLAPFTAIVGAVAGANLLVVLHDMSRTHSAPTEPHPDTTPADARDTEVRPVTPTPA